MDVRIYPDEEIRITAVDHEGKERHMHVSWKTVMFDGVKIMDGLVEEEIQAIEDSRKIWAIKMCKVRTGFALKEAKDLVDAWIKRNKCCDKWPYCPHHDAAAGIDLTKLTLVEVGSLAMSWTYADNITVEVAYSTMDRKGYSPKAYGMWSFVNREKQTTWMSNRLPNPV